MRVHQRLLPALLLSLPVSCTDGGDAALRPTFPCAPASVPGAAPCAASEIPAEDCAFVWSGRARLEPAVGTFFGVSLDHGADSIPAYNARLGHDAADYVRFVDFPMEPEDEARMGEFLEGVAERRGLALMTFEPRVPLADVTRPMVEDLADFLADYNDALELGILVRFAHEMNGSWYSWGQQPTAYVRVYRMVAEAIHRKATRSAMVWAPNHGSGYPFPGGPYLTRPGHPDFPLLDTDGDGALTERDDMYLPYYPGDAYVDWVALSLYHWGHRWPWGDNEVPEPHKFIDDLTGRYVGLGGDQRGVPDFYAVYSDGHDKPMALAETAALYNPDRGGADELEIKRLWWSQVFSAEVFDRFPRLRLINWFEHKKRTDEEGGTSVDWTVTVTPRIREAFLEDLPTERLLFAPIPAYDP